MLQASTGGKACRVASWHSFRWHGMRQRAEGADAMQESGSGGFATYLRVGQAEVTQQLPSTPWPHQHACHINMPALPQALAHLMLASQTAATSPTPPLTQTPWHQHRRRRPPLHHSPGARQTSACKAHRAWAACMARHSRAASTPDTADPSRPPAPPRRPLPRAGGDATSPRKAVSHDVEYPPASWSEEPPPRRRRCPAGDPRRSGDGRGAAARSFSLPLSARSYHCPAAVLVVTTLAAPASRNCELGGVGMSVGEKRAEKWRGHGPLDHDVLVEPALYGAAWRFGWRFGCVPHPPNLQHAINIRACACQPSAAHTACSEV
eukprot:366147-Chlamydomonas_euryale.AAC.15